MKEAILNSIKFLLGLAANGPHKADAAARLKALELADETETSNDGTPGPLTPPVSSVTKLTGIQEGDDE